jgi:hypothetical protein
MTKPIQRMVCFEYKGKKYSRPVFLTKKGNSKMELATDEALIANWKATIDRAEKIRERIKKK